MYRGEIRELSNKFHEMNSQAVLWISKTRSAIKRELRTLLSKVDNAEADIFLVTTRLDSSWRKAEALQESRNALLEAMTGYMVPSADLHEALSELTAFSAEVERLSALEAFQAKEIDGLTGSLLVAQHEIDRHVAAMQVCSCCSRVEQRFSTRNRC
jgi:hypothetical protein